MTEHSTKQTSSRSALLGGRKRLKPKRSSWLKTLPAPVKLACVLLLVMLVLSVSGCGVSLQTHKPDSPRNPTKPALTEPLPSVKYSTVAQGDIQTWRKKLTDTPTTPKP